MSKPKAPMEPDRHDFGDDGPLFARARKSDPETSREAARKVTWTGAASRQGHAIMCAMKDWRDSRRVGSIGATSSEIAEWIHDLDRYQVARRLPEMREAGWVKNGPARKCSVTGNKAMTWEIA